jgi:hypothetical protein
MKCDAFWKSKVTADGSNPRRLWQSIDALLGRVRPPPCSAVDAEEMHRFFDEKVAGESFHIQECFYPNSLNRDFWR